MKILEDIRSPLQSPMNSIGLSIGDNATHHKMARSSLHLYLCSQMQPVGIPLAQPFFSSNLIPCIPSYSPGCCVWWTSLGPNRRSQADGPDIESPAIGPDSNRELFGFVIEMALSPITPLNLSWIKWTQDDPRLKALALFMTHLERFANDLSGSLLLNK